MKFHKILITIMVFVALQCKDKETVETKPFTLSSSAFANMATIPNKFSCKGGATGNVSPELSWQNMPSGTQSYCLIMDDPLALEVAGIVWDHWLVFEIPISVSSIPENGKTFLQSKGASILQNSNGVYNYSGPCPPNGRIHTYEFKLYAMKKSKFIIGNGVTKGQIMDTIRRYALDSAKYFGKFGG